MNAGETTGDRGTFRNDPKEPGTKPTLLGLKCWVKPLFFDSGGGIEV